MIFLFSFVEKKRDILGFYSQISKDILEKIKVKWEFRDEFGVVFLSQIFWSELSHLWQVPGMARTFSDGMPLFWRLSNFRQERLVVNSNDYFYHWPPPNKHVQFKWSGIARISKYSTNRSIRTSMQSLSIQQHRLNQASTDTSTLLRAAGNKCANFSKINPCHAMVNRTARPNKPLSKIKWKE